MTVDKRVAELERAQARNEAKLDALHEVVEMLIGLINEEPREDQFAAAAARFRKAAGA